MTNISDMQDASNDRRTFLRICGGAGALASGLSLLSACKDDVVGIEAVPQATPTSPVVGAPPAYTATDGDRYNFLLQMHYLLAAYFQRGVYGTILTAAQTSGSGTAGGVTGGTQVTFADPVVAATLREVANNTVSRLLFLRRTLGSAVTAQPPINISGGQNSPFDDISLVPPAAGTPARTTFFNPYASETEFLLGAVVMLSIVAAVVNDLAWRATSTSRDTFGRLVGGAYLDNGIVRNAMFLRAAAEPRRLPTGQTSLFMRVAFMAGARDRLDGPQDFEKWLGEFTGGVNGMTYNAAITPNDPNGMAFRRSAEQTLNISFATQNVATSGGFFPSGVNGLIRTSGNNLF